jgi:hypothetical protein
MRGDWFKDQNFCEHLENFSISIPGRTLAALDSLFAGIE